MTDVALLLAAAAMFATALYFTRRSSAPVPVKVERRRQRR